MLLAFFVSPALAGDGATTFWITTGGAAAGGAVVGVPTMLVSTRLLSASMCEGQDVCDPSGPMAGGLFYGVAGAGLGAAAGGALTHALQGHPGAWKVALASGGTALVSDGLVAAGGLLLAESNESAGAGLALLVTGMVGNVVGVPFTAGAVSASSREPRAGARPAVEVTELAVLPMVGGASVRVGVRF